MSSRFSGYDALPSATDAIILFANLMLVHLLFFPTHPHWVYVFILPLIGAAVNAYAAQHVLRNKKRLHEMPESKVEKEPLAFNDQNLLTLERQAEKKEWEKQVNQYQLQQELHTNDGINKTTLAVFFGYLLSAIAVGLPIYFRKEPIIITLMVALFFLFFFSLFTQQITARHWTHTFGRSLLFLFGLAGCIYLLRSIFLSS